MFVSVLTNKSKESPDDHLSKSDSSLDDYRQNGPKPRRSHSLSGGLAAKVAQIESSNQKSIKSNSDHIMKTSLSMTQLTKIREELHKEIQKKQHLDRLSQSTGNLNLLLQSNREVCFASNKADTQDETKEEREKEDHKTIKNRKIRRKTLPSSHIKRERKENIKQDLLSSLPNECSVYILNYLNLIDLYKVSQVSKKWFTLVSDQIVWTSAVRRFWAIDFKTSHSLKIYNKTNVMNFHGHTINSIEFDSSKLVTIGRDGWIKIWKLYNNKLECMHTITDHDGPVLCCQYDHDKLISGSADRTIRIFDLKTFECKHILQGHSESVTCLHFGSKYLFSGSRDGCIKIWNLKKNFKLISSFHFHSPISCMKVISRYIVCATEDHTLRIFNWKNSKACSYEIRLPGFVWCVEIDKEAKRIVTSCSDKFLRIYKIPKEESVGGTGTMGGKDGKVKHKLDCLQCIYVDTSVYSMQCDKYNIFLGVKEGVVVYDYQGKKHQEIWKGGRRVSALRWKGNKFIFSQMDIDYEGERIPHIDLVVITLN